MKEAKKTAAPKRSALAAFQDKMSRSIKSEEHGQYVRPALLSQLEEDVQFLRKLDQLGPDGHRLMLEALRLMTEAWKGLWYKSRYLEVSGELTNFRQTIRDEAWDKVALNEDPKGDWKRLAGLCRPADEDPDPDFETVED